MRDREREREREREVGEKKKVGFGNLYSEDRRECVLFCCGQWAWEA
jgi:hypothetical protein